LKSNRFSCSGVTPEDPEWHDWKWQLRNRITCADKLAEFLPLNDRQKKEIDSCLGRFRMAVSPYYASLIDPADPNCPIRAQAVPSIGELQSYEWEKTDPLNEEKDSPVKNIVHRYPDRVLFLVSSQCATYCRHCVRNRLFGENDLPITEADTENAIAYIEGKPQIRDVLISGGDPLLLEDDKLERIIKKLRAIPHVQIIRIGTRVPVTLPMRITGGLLSMLKKDHPGWSNTHFNHPRELTEISLSACAAIVDSGIPLGNQSVLLKNINDNTDIMKELLLGLVKARIRPYYLYQCDLYAGSEHFRTKVETGIEIIKNLTGYISGFAIPKFVIDAPDGGGKIPIGPEYIESIDDEKIVMRNYRGGIYSYPQPK